MPDPQLQKAIEEIRPILRKYDCCAVLILQSKAHAEFAIHLEPEWSCVKEEETPQGKGIRVRALAKDYPNKEEHRKALSIGIGMIMCFIDVMENLSNQLIALAGHISKKVEISHVSTNETDPSNRRKFL